MAFQLAFPILPGMGQVALASGEMEGNVDGDGDASPAQNSSDSKSQNFSNLFTGGSAYGIPISGSPGLGLSYSSDAREKSWVGAGWSLGVGEIVRKGEQNRVAKFDATDTFALRFGGNSDLIVHPGSAGNEYVTENDNFARIEKDSANNKWIVRSTDGTVAEFGQPILRVNPATVDFNNTRAWAITKITDTAGYWTEFTYDIDPVGGDYYPKYIDATFGPSGLDTKSRVEFVLEARPAQSTMAQYSSGSKVEMDKRLREIRLFADRGTGLLSGRYELSYRNNTPAPGSTDWTGPENFLANVTEFGTAGSGRLNRWEFNYSQKSAGWGPDTGQTFPFQFVQYVSGSTKNLGVRFGDLDLDGRLDLFKSEQIPYDRKIHALFLNRAAGFEDVSIPFPMEFSRSETIQGGISTIPNNFLVDPGVQLLDLDGDGRPEMVQLLDVASNCHAYDGLDQKNVWKYDGSGWVHDSILSSGLPNNLWFVNWSCSPTSPDLFNGASQTIMSRPGAAEVANLNGDPFPDLMVPSYGARYSPTAFLNNGDGTWTTLTAPGTLGSVPLSPIEFLSSNISDINGDGLGDILSLPAFSGDTCDVILNKGGSWARDSQLSLLCDQSIVANLASLRGLTFTDINADGYVDAVSNTKVLINRQQEGFVDICATRCTPYDFLSSGPSPVALGTLLMDLDADGLVDFVNSNGVAGYGSVDGDKVYPANGQFPGQLSTVTLPSGGSIAFDYKPSTDPVFAMADGTPGNPQLPFVKQLLRATTVSDGRGASYTTTYKYQGGAFDAADREFRGFALATVTDPSGNRSETYFHQTDELKGKVNVVRAYDSAGYLFGDTRYSYTRDFATPDCGAGNLDCSEPYFNPVRRVEATACEAGSNCHKVISENRPVFNDNFSTVVVDPAPNDRLTAVVSWNHGEPGRTPPDKRTTGVTRLVSNETAWVLHVPVRSRVYQGIVASDSGENHLLESSVYYDAGSGSFAPGTPLLTQQPNNGRVVRSEARGHDGLSAFSEATYDPVYKHPLTLKDALGRISRVFYDADPEGDHPANLYPTRVQDPMGNEATTNYDAFGRVASTRDANGLVSAAHYDAFHRPYRSTAGTVANPEMFESRVEFHGFCDDPTYNCDPNRLASGDVQYTKALAKRTASKWVWSESYVDGLGRGFRSVQMGVDPQTGLEHSGYSAKNEVRFDPQGRASKNSVPYVGSAPSPGDPLKWTSYTYDSVGRVATARAPSTDSNAFVASMAYDTLEYSEFSPMQKQKDYLFNSLGQLDRVIEYNGEASHFMSYAYDVLGRLTSIVDSHAPNRNIVTVSYDSFGGKTQMTDADMGTWRYTYDSIGRLSTQTDPRGYITRLSYDSLDRVVRSETGIPTTGFSTADEYIYDKIGGAPRNASIGQLLQVKRSKVTLPRKGLPYGQVETYYLKDLFYDALGRMVRNETTISGVKVATALIYNADQELQSITLDDDPNSQTRETVSFAYDDLGRVKTMTGASDYVRRILSDEIGRPKKLEVGNGIQTLYTYDDALDRRLSRIQTGTSANPGALLDHYLLYDTDSNIKELHDSVKNRQFIYEYDDLNRLTETETYSNSSGLAEKRVYSYDPMGNMLSLSGSYRPFMQSYGPAPTATPNSGGGGGCTGKRCLPGKTLDGRDGTGTSSGSTTSTSSSTSAPTTVSETESISYQYDLAGRLHAPVADTYHQFQYDAAGNLVQVSDIEKTTWFDYDGQNNLSKVAQDSAVLAEYLYSPLGGRIAKSVGGSVTERYFGSVEMKNGNKAKYYFLGGQRIARRDEAGQLTFFHGDHLGSNSILTNESGTPVMTREYYEFGALKAQTGSNVDSYAFGDKRLGEGDLYDFEARSHAAKFSRFTQPDSIVPDALDPQSYNRYAYVRNNPINRIDPSGHFDFTFSSDPSDDPAGGGKGGGGGGGFGDVGEDGGGYDTWGIMNGGGDAPREVSRKERRYYADDPAAMPGSYNSDPSTPYRGPQAGGAGGLRPSDYPGIAGDAIGSSISSVAVWIQDLMAESAEYYEEPEAQAGLVLSIVGAKLPSRFSGGSGRVPRSAPLSTVRGVRAAGLPTASGTARGIVTRGGGFVTTADGREAYVMRTMARTEGEESFMFGAGAGRLSTEKTGMSGRPIKAAQGFPEEIEGIPGVKIATDDSLFKSQISRLRMYGPSEDGVPGAVLIFKAPVEDFKIFRSWSTPGNGAQYMAVHIPKGLLPYAISPVTINGTYPAGSASVIFHMAVR